jgi:ABC-type sugar transport system ATPase subunit
MLSSHWRCFAEDCGILSIPVVNPVRNIFSCQKGCYPMMLPVSPSILDSDHALSDAGHHTSPLPYLELQGVQKRFGETAVLHDISLSIQAGEFVVFVGASGCGKSTLLRCIAGLETPTAGAITLEGEDLLHRDAKDRNVAMVFQNYALYPHMNVYDNMAFGLKMRKTPKAEIQKTVLATAQMLGLEPLLKRKPGQLSGGQCQRVALGRAIVRQPKLFLMDEPLSNLDAQLRQHMRHELKALHKRLGATTLYVTHDHTETLTLADKVVVLNKGRIAQCASPETVYHAPADVYVARFMAHMNLFRLEQDADGQIHLFHVEDPTRPVSTEGASASRLLAEGLVLPQTLQDRLNSQKSRAFIVGIKPEHTTPGLPSGSAYETTEHLLVRLPVVARELHGAFQTLRFAIDSTAPVDAVAYAPFTPGETPLTKEGFHFKWEHARLFDASTGLSL